MKVSVVTHLGQLQGLQSDHCVEIPSSSYLRLSPSI